MKLKSMAAIAAMAAMHGCAQMMPGIPGHVSVNRSEFDGATEIQMQPAWVYPESFRAAELKIGFFWKSAPSMHGKYVMTAAVSQLASIPTDNSLEFIIDGERYALSSIEAVTQTSYDPGVYSNGIYVPGQHESSKQYLVDAAFLDKLVSAHDARVRLNLGREYVTGVFSLTTTPDNAHDSALIFVQQVREAGGP